MTAATPLGILLRQVPEEHMLGLRRGELKLFGSVIRNASNGQIVDFLQEAAPLAKLVGAPARVVGGAIPFAGELIQSAQVEHIKNGVELLKTLGVADLALGGIGLGVSVAGFAVMLAKIEGLKRDIDALSAQIKGLGSRIEDLQRDGIDADFAEVEALSRGFDEGWRLSASGAEHRWRDVAQGALVCQSRFELRADRILNHDPSRYAEAIPFVDAVAMTNALRVAALCAGEEVDAARAAAFDGGRNIERLTGNIGLADLSRVERLKTGARAGSPRWARAQAEATAATRAMACGIRQREAAAYTRAAPLAELERRGVRPRDWLEAAREEKISPILVLRAAG